MNTASYHTGTNNSFPNVKFILYAIALAVIAMVLLLGTGCNMPKYCAEHFPPTIERHDSIAYIEVEKLRDTTIYIPGESYLIFDSIPCDENNKAQLPEKKVKTNRGQMSISVKDGKLKADCKTDSLQAVITAKDRTISKLQESREVAVKTVYQKTKFDKFCNWFFWIVCALLVGFIVAKLLKIYAKVQLPFIP